MKVVYSILFILFLVSCKKDENNTSTVVASNQTNVAYGNDSQQKMDIYLPANRSVDSTKLFVFIHGGGWMSGDKSDFNALYPYFNASLQNYAFVSLNYRLCDTNTNTNLFPSQEDDIVAALDFIKGKLSEWKVSDKVVLCGASAGGHLTLLHGYKHNNDHFVKAIVDYFGPTQLDSIYTANPATELIMDKVIGGSPAQYPAMYFSSSPTNYLTSNSVPTLIFHGTADPLVPIQQSYLLEQLLVNNGVVHNQTYYQGDSHGFTIPNTLNSIDKTRQFLDLVNP